MPVNPVDRIEGFRAFRTGSLVGFRDRRRVRVSLCMINYNGEVYLRKSLPAALRQAERFEEILLVDNGSTDGCLDLWSTILPAVRGGAVRWKIAAPGPRARRRHPGSQNQYDLFPR